MVLGSSGLWASPGALLDMLWEVLGHCFSDVAPVAVDLINPTDIKHESDLVWASASGRQTLAHDYIKLAQVQKNSTLIFAYLKDRSLDQDALRTKISAEIRELRIKGKDSELPFTEDSMNCVLLDKVNEVMGQKKKKRRVSQMAQKEASQADA